MLDAKGKAAVTVQELADRVLEERKNAYADGRQQAAVVETDQIGPGDVSLVRRIVVEAGFQGAAADEMTQRVSDRVADRIKALADDLPSGASA